MNFYIFISPRYNIICHRCDYIREYTFIYLYACVCLFVCKCDGSVKHQRQCNRGVKSKWGIQCKGKFKEGKKLRLMEIRRVDKGDGKWAVRGVVLRWYVEAVVIVNFLIKFSQRREPRNDFFIIQFGREITIMGDIRAENVWCRALWSPIRPPQIYYFYDIEN